MFVVFLLFGRVPSHEELMITKREGWHKLELTTRLQGIEGSKRAMKLNSSLHERNFMSTWKGVEGIDNGGSNTNIEEIVNASTYEEDK